MLIPDALVQKAFDWLKDNAEPAAAAKALRIQSEHNTKRVKAEMFLRASGSVAEREAIAITSDEYQQAVQAEAEAVKQDEYNRHQRGRAEAIIDAWRTEQSNNRAMGRVG